MFKANVCYDLPHNKICLIELMYHPFKGTQWACFGKGQTNLDFRMASYLPSSSLHLSCQLKQIFNVSFFIPLNRL